ncbi:MAG: DUF5668 domain-containing protein [Arenimonas sp.]
MRSPIVAILLIVFGVLLLLQKQRLIPDLGPLFHDWWPLLLVIAGVGLLIRRGKRG